MTELHWHNHLKYILQELHWIFVWICFIVCSNELENGICDCLQEFSAHERLKMQCSW